MSISAAEADDTFTIGQLTYQNNGNTCSVVSVAADAETITIPAEIDGLPVFWGAANSNSVSPVRSCTALREILVEEGNAQLQSIDGVLFTDETTLVAYPAAKEGSVYTIPEGTLTIGREAFSRCNRLEIIQMADSVLTADGYAFYQCEALREFVGAVPMAAGNSVYQCSSLASITISGTPASLAFSGYPALSSLQFTDDAVVSGNIIISDCPALTALSLPEGRMNTAFSQILRISNCDNLETLTFYNTALYLRQMQATTNNSIVENCPKLREITVLAQENCSSARPLVLSSLPELAALTFEEEQSGLIEDNATSYSVLQAADCGSFTVYGTDTNTVLRTFCEENAIPYAVRSSEAVLGDVNTDGKVDIMDVIMLNKNLLGGCALSQQGRLNADVDLNGKVDSADSLNIMKYIVGILPSFPGK